MMGDYPFCTLCTYTLLYLFFPIGPCRCISPSSTLPSHQVLPNLHQIDWEEEFLLHPDNFDIWRISFHRARCWLQVHFSCFVFHFKICKATIIKQIAPLFSSQAAQLQIFVEFGIEEYFFKGLYDDIWFFSLVSFSASEYEMSSSFKKSPHRPFN